MRQLIQSYRSGEMRLEEVPKPVVMPGYVLVETAHSLVSAGTEKMIVDLAKKSLLGKARARPDLVQKVVSAARKQGVATALQKARAKLDTPIPLGYSASGVVVEVGPGVEGFGVGDRVACGGAGYANHADYNCVPRNLVAHVPDGLALSQAAFATVGAIALQGVRQAAPQLGERAVVLGLGLIGQLAAQLLRANGCRVLGFDPDPQRARMAEELGVHMAVSSDLEEAALRFSRGEGCDLTLVAASSQSAEPLRQAGEVLRQKGRVVVVGLVGMEIPRSLYYRKELDLRMSMSYGPGRYDPAYEERGLDYPIGQVRWSEGRNLDAFLTLAADGGLALEPLVTHRYAIDQALSAYELISSRKEPYLGVLLDYDPSTAEEQPRRAGSPRPSARALDHEQVGLGFVGAGGFAQSVLLPALKAEAVAVPVAISSARGTTAQRIGERYGFRRVLQTAEEVISDPEVDAVFVLTRHDLHAAMAVQALDAGKWVFTEKPLALNHDELAPLERALLASQGGLMVGFNRRFSPFAQEIRSHFEGRSSPLMLRYRINAGFIPADHWVHDPVEGGGRIIGEACHFVDLLQYLVGAVPTRVFSEAITGGSRFRTDDNMEISLRFADGSIASITYTSMGDARLSKERLEVFGEGRVAVLDDFRLLELFRDGRLQRRKSREQAKGFREELGSFLAAVRSGDPSPIDMMQLLATTRATFAALESLQSGQPVSL